jgi:hypothetical protein
MYTGIHMRYAERMSEGLRKLRRREYLRRHAANRRTTAKADGARRIDVTLRGEMLDNYAVVRGYLEHLNQLEPLRRLFGDAPAFRLSDTEVINMALDRAASAITEELSEPVPAAVGNFGSRFRK